MLQAATPFAVATAHTKCATPQSMQLALLARGLL